MQWGISDGGLPVMGGSFCTLDVPAVGVISSMSLLVIRHLIVITCIISVKCTEIIQTEPFVVRLVIFIK